MKRDEKLARLENDRKLAFEFRYSADPEATAFGPVSS